MCFASPPASPFTPRLLIWFTYKRTTITTDRHAEATAQQETAAQPSTGTTGKSDGMKGSLLIIFGFAMLGITVGWLTGDSGEQVLSSVLPAVLSLVGALAVYLIGHQLRDSAVIASGVASLAINLLVGTLLAAANADQAASAAVEIKEAQAGAALREVIGKDKISDLESLANQAIAKSSAEK